MKTKSFRNKLEFFEQRPSFAEIKRCWEISSFSREVERAITLHPEWGFLIVEGSVQEIEF